jgi:hypothetical protein
LLVECTPSPRAHVAHHAPHRADRTHQLGAGEALHVRTSVCISPTTVHLTLSSCCPPRQTAQKTCAAFEPPSLPLPHTGVCAPGRIASRDFITRSDSGGRARCSPLLCWLRMPRVHIQAPLPTGLPLPRVRPSYSWLPLLGLQQARVRPTLRPRTHASRRWWHGGLDGAPANLLFPPSLPSPPGAPSPFTTPTH